MIATPEISNVRDLLMQILIRRILSFLTFNLFPRILTEKDPLIISISIIIVISIIRGRIDI